MCVPAIRCLVVAAATLVTACPASACLWDYDTLRDEKRGLPGIAEVLAGRFEKHSEFFYRQRVAAMEELLRREPGDLDAWDNLAVAHEKLGDIDKAIEVILKKEKLAPGRYTTYANLGTFHLHKGNWDEGIRWIEKALAINPDAHFGREEYQLKLAKFLRAAKADPELAKKGNFLGVDFHFGHNGSIRFVRNGQPDAHRKLGLKDNVFDGIVGILRFGTGKSAELYFVLGELLSLRGDMHLADRAYRRALEFGHPQRKYIEEAIEEVEGYIHGLAGDSPEQKYKVVDAAIAKERAEAEEWVRAYQEFEDGLVRSGRYTGGEEDYREFYDRHGRAVVVATNTLDDLLPRDGPTRFILVVVSTVLLTVVLSIAALWTIRRRDRAVGWILVVLVVVASGTCSVVLVNLSYPILMARSE